MTYQQKYKKCEDLVTGIRMSSGVDGKRSIKRGIILLKNIHDLLGKMFAEGKESEIDYLKEIPKRFKIHWFKVPTEKEYEEIYHSDFIKVYIQRVCDGIRKYYS